MRANYGKEVSYEGKQRETKAFGFYVHPDQNTRHKGDPKYLKEYVYIKESIGDKEKTPFRVVIYPFPRSIQLQLAALPTVKNELISFNNHSEYGLKTVKGTGYVRFTPSIPNTQFGIEVAVHELEGLKQLISFINNIDDALMNGQAPYPPRK